MAKLKPKDQKSIDRIAEKRGPTPMGPVANDAFGGEYGNMGRVDGKNLDDPKPKFRGIKIHDKGQDSWGLKNLPRYEE